MNQITSFLVIISLLFSQTSFVFAQTLDMDSTGLPQPLPLKKP